MRLTECSVGDIVMYVRKHSGTRGCIHGLLPSGQAAVKWEDQDKPVFEHVIDLIKVSSAPVYLPGDKVLCLKYTSQGEICEVTAVRPYRTVNGSIAYAYDVTLPGGILQNRVPCWHLCSAS